MKIIEKLKKNHRWQIACVQFVFILIAIGFTILQTYYGRTWSMNDTIFNYQRLIEAMKQVLHFQLPQFNLYSALPYGIAIPSFYPWVTLIVFSSLLFIIHSPVLLWNTVLSLIMLIGLEISFYTYKTVSNHDLSAFLFSIFYCFSTISLAFAIASSDIGAYFCTFLAPMVFFGWWHWIRQGHWKMMSIGMVLMLYSHVITTLIMIFALMILTICFWWYTADKMHKLIQLSKGALIAILAGCITWLPLIVLTRNNLVAAPTTGNLRVANLYSIIPNSIFYLVGPYFYRIWTFSDLACFILAIIYWKRLTNKLRIYFGIAMGFILLNAPVIKNFLIFKTPVSQIQIIARVNFVSHFLLSLILVWIIINVLLKRWYIQNTLSLIGTLLVIMIGSVVLTNGDMMNLTKYPQSHFKQVVNRLDAGKDNRAMMHDININTNYSRIVFGNKDMSENAFLHCCSRYDYAPRNEAIHFGLMMTKAKSSFGEQVNLIPRDNGKIEFNLKHSAHTMLIPITMYHTQKYHLKLDKHIKNWSFSNKYGSVRLHHLTKGRHEVQLKIPTMKYRYYSLLITLVGWLAYLCPHFDKRKKEVN